MMSIHLHKSKDQQQIESLFSGAFTENKPIPFPDQYGTQAYSNLFYWAHLIAHETSEFPLHPHRGFEILTFVFKGKVEHYDTASGVYTPLEKGDVQVIRAGSGVEHSERIHQGTELFQIWFDPDFSLSLKQEAGYKDYAREEFIPREVQGVEETPYLYPDGPLKMQTPLIAIHKMQFNPGSYTRALDPGGIYSCYLLEGALHLDQQAMHKDDFCIIREQKELKIEVAEASLLFVIKTPALVPYACFKQRYTSLAGL